MPSWVISEMSIKKIKVIYAMQFFSIELNCAKNYSSDRQLKQEMTSDKVSPGL